MTLRELRKSLGLTQAQIASKLQVTTQAYQQWESGTRKPGADALVMIAERLRLVVVINPATRNFDVIPEHLYEDPTAKMTGEEIMDTYSYMFEDE